MSGVNALHTYESCPGAHKCTDDRCPWWDGLRVFLHHGNYNVSLYEEPDERWRVVSESVHFGSSDRMYSTRERAEEAACEAAISLLIDLGFVDERKFFGEGEHR